MRLCREMGIGMEVYNYNFLTCYYYYCTFTHGVITKTKTLYNSINSRILLLSLKKYLECFCNFALEVVMCFKPTWYFHSWKVTTSFFLSQFLSIIPRRSIVRNRIPIIIRTGDFFFLWVVCWEGLKGESRGKPNISAFLLCSVGFSTSGVRSWRFDWLTASQPTAPRSLTRIPHYTYISLREARALLQYSIQLVYYALSSLKSKLTPDIPFFPNEKG